MLLQTAADYCKGTGHHGSAGILIWALDRTKVPRKNFSNFVIIDIDFGTRNFLLLQTNVWREGFQMLTPKERQVI